MNSVRGLMEEAETGDAEEMGNFSHNEDVLFSSSVDRSECHSWVPFKVSMVSKFRSDDLDLIDCHQIKPRAYFK